MAVSVTNQAAAVTGGSGSAKVALRSNDTPAAVRFNSKYKLYNLSAPEPDYYKKTKSEALEKKLERSLTLDPKKSVAASLKKSADEILRRGEGLMEMSFKSDKPQVAVTRSNAAAPKGKTAVVAVSQTAAPQVVNGALVPSGGADFKRGANSFTVEKGGREYKFNVNVKEGDTNRDVAKKTADAINRRDIGVKATFAEERAPKPKAPAPQEKAQSAAPASRVALKSADTGEAAAFSVNDANSDLARKLGLSKKTPDVKARDAIYSVNGAVKRSPQNNVTIPGVADVELKSKTDEAATISAAPDTAAFKKALNRLADDYNSYAAQNNASVAASRANALDGVSVSKGKISVNADAVVKAALASDGYQNDARAFLTDIVKNVSNQIAPSNRGLLYEALS